MHGLNAQGVDFTYDDATKAVYGMPLKEWKSKHQKATEAQLTLLENHKHLHADTSAPKATLVAPVGAPLIHAASVEQQRATQQPGAHSNVCCPTDSPVPPASMNRL